MPLTSAPKKTTKDEKQNTRGQGKTLKLPGDALDPVVFPSFAAERDPYLGFEEIPAVAYLPLEIH